MCRTPNQLADGTLVACRECWQCRERKINDWVGRCIAEGETSIACNSLTLTYGGGDQERAAVLTYSDVQKYFKRLRKNGFPLKYFAVGEYGSAKGRSHWHLITFWKDKVPPHELKKNFQDEHWPHGWSFWDEVNPASIRYVCKYLQKDMGKDERQGHLAMSKKPPLGHDYFQRLALRYVENGLAPQDLFYSFDHARDKDGQKTQFMMSGVTASNYLAGYLRQWAEKHGAEHPPYSEILEEFIDAQVPDRFEIDPRAYSPSQPRPTFYPPFYKAEDVGFDPVRNAFYIVMDERTFKSLAGAYTPPSERMDGDRLYWSFNEDGERAWQDVIRVQRDAPLSSNLGAYRAKTVDH